MNRSIMIKTLLQNNQKPKAMYAKICKYLKCFEMVKNQTFWTTFGRFLLALTNTFAVKIVIQGKIFMKKGNEKGENGREKVTDKRERSKSENFFHEFFTLFLNTGVILETNFEKFTPQELV